MVAQSAALQAQQEILNNGEELRVTLRDSTQGKKKKIPNNALTPLLLTV